MRPGLLALALVVLAAVVGVGLLLLGSPRPEHGARRVQIGAETVENGSPSPVPSAVTPAELAEGALEALAPSTPGEGQPDARGATGTIRGRVVGAPAELRNMLEVVATPVDAGRAQSVTRCDPEGCFSFEGLEADQTYDLRVVVAGRPSFGRPRAEPRLTTPGPREVELAWMPERALIFQVADARTGLAVTDFEVRLGRTFLRPLLDEGGRIRGHFPQGRVRWVAWAEGEEREPFDLVVSARGYRELRVGALLAPLRADFELGRLVLEPAPRLVVRVVDGATEAPVAGAQVGLAHAVDAARRRDGQAFDPCSGRTDQEGRVTLSRFPGEEALLMVRHADYADLDRALVLTLAEEQRETVALERR